MTCHFEFRAHLRSRVRTTSMGLPAAGRSTRSAMFATACAIGSGHCTFRRNSWQQDADLRSPRVRVDVIFPGATNAYFGDSNQDGRHRNPWAPKSCTGIGRNRLRQYSGIRPEKLEKLRLLRVSGQRWQSRGTLSRHSRMFVLNSRNHVGLACTPPPTLRIGKGAYDRTAFVQ